MAKKSVVHQIGDFIEAMMWAKRYPLYGHHVGNLVGPITNEILREGRSIGGYFIVEILKHFVSLLNYPKLKLVNCQKLSNSYTTETRPAWAFYQLT